MQLLPVLPQQLGHKLYHTMKKSVILVSSFDWLGWDLTTHQTLVSHFVSSPRGREQRDRRDSREDERKGQGRKRKMNESEETEEIKTPPLTLPAARIEGLAQL